MAGELITRPAKRPRTEEPNTTFSDQGPLQAGRQEALECPVCFEQVVPPIYQCSAGHLLCSTCYPQLDICPCCREPLGGIRNLAIEKFAKRIRLQFPCKFQGKGCTDVVFPMEREEHQENCDYRPCPCPLSHNLCTWTGPRSQVLEHVATCCDRGPGILTIDSRTMCFSNVITGHLKFFRSRILSCFGHKFLFTFLRKRRDGEVRYDAFVKFLGAPKDANIFSYKLMLNQDQQFLTWEDTPRSIYERYQSIILGSSLTFNMETANEFVEDRKLSVHVIISKEVETD